MNVRPLGDRVVVKRLPAEDKIGMIIVPDVAKEKPTKAEVLAVGNGRTLADGTVVAPEVKKGDIVLFGKYSGTEVKVGDDHLVVLREEDLMGVFET